MTLDALSSIPPHQIIALNDAELSENQIHRDDIAAKYGFTGALVSGVNVFGYLTQPLVKAYGEEVLSKGIMDVIFLKPAYHGKLLSIRTENLDSANHDRHHLTSAFDEAGVLLAKLESWLPLDLPPISNLARRVSGLEQQERVEINWDLIHLQRAAPSCLWQPTAEDNRQRIEALQDDCEIYRREAALIHPYFLLDACNKALMRMFVLPAWIHTGSRLTLRKPIRTGQAVDVRTIPVQKWERKGHQFIKLYIAMWIDEQVALEVEHSAIFKIAG